MPTIASLAPNNTSLHLNLNYPVNKRDDKDSVKLQLQSIGYMESDPQISPLTNLSPDPSIDSRRDSLAYSISSPTKSELSINTDASSTDIKSDMGSLSIKSEVCL
uniref:C2H2-type domain-containing protein n=1 Tax=Panagrolaimus sp. PS1159 TaxID=55785 RepID=A0AC35GDD6_9BILA